jgi:glycosyltransferase involved in cell wall biosynthesis
MPAGAVKPLHQLRPERAGAVILHYSGHAPGLEQMLPRAPRSLLVSHNITPAHYFWSSDPVEAVRCQLARAQLAELAGVATALAGVSQFNARELSEISGRDADVLPVVFDRTELPPGHVPHMAAGPTILFVGRLTPHKRQDLVIRAFARWRDRARLPAARLQLVGTPLSSDFLSGLSRLADSLAPGAVTFASGLSAHALHERYRTADVFLCLSEHEGFCIPLLEAFHFGLPVIARDAGAVAEVVGDAGVIVRDRDGDGVATVAELVRIVLADDELKAELAQRGERRLGHYARDAVAGQLRDQLATIGVT